MSIPQAILDLENRSLGSHGEPTLGSALALAVAEWNDGNRDRELRLHLLFMCWHCNLEPPHLTGFDEEVMSSADLPKLFHDVYETFADGIADDAECLYVVGLMRAQLSPWLLGADVPRRGNGEAASSESGTESCCPKACRPLTSTAAAHMGNTF